MSEPWFKTTIYYYLSHHMGLILALGPILDTDDLLPYNYSPKKCGCMERALMDFTSQRQQALVDSEH